MRTLLEVKDLRRRPGIPGKGELKQISFSVKTGEVVCLLGSARSGLRAIPLTLFGLARSSGGKVRILDDYSFDPAKRRRVAYLPGPYLPPGELSVTEFFQLSAALYKVPYSQDKISNLEKELDLYPRRKQRLSGFSTGIRKLCYLAASLLAMPDLVVLEDFSAGLDEVSGTKISELLLDVTRRDGGVLLLASRVGILERAFHPVCYFVHDGRVIKEGDLQELEMDEEIVEAEVDGVPEELLSAPGVIRSQELGDRVLLEVFPQGWTAVESKIVDGGGVILTQSRRTLSMKEILDVA